MALTLRLIAVESVVRSRRGGGHDRQGALRPAAWVAVGGGMLALVLASAAGWSSTQRPIAAAKASGTVTLAGFSHSARLTAANAALVKGRFGCSPRRVAVLSIRVTLVERTKPAPGFGVGTWRGRCVKSGRWRTKITSTAPFSPGSARACAVGIETRTGTIVDAVLWCQNSS